MSTYEPPFVLRNLTQLPTHLNDAYGIDVVEVTELDLGVLRIDQRGGPSWIARVFPVARPMHDVQKDAGVLQGLERGGFPAERLARENAVTQFEGQGVVVTTFVPGVKPKADGRTFAYLGSLLGRLHTREGADIPPGGGWHHLVSSGTPKDEVSTLQGLLEQFGTHVGNDDLEAFNILQAEVDAIDVCDDLPHSFVHPDMVPENALELKDGTLVIVDWANAGRGPRVWSHAMTLFAAGARDLRLVEKVISRYVKHSNLNELELDRLEGVLHARPLTIHAWGVVHGISTLAETNAMVRFFKRVSTQTTEAARAAFAIER